MMFKNFFEKTSQELKDGNFEIPNVPFYSQELSQENFQVEGFTSLEDAKYWSERICGLACLKMVLGKFFPDKNFTLKELLDIGLKIGAYDEKVGWKHQGLVDLAANFDVNGFRQSIEGDIQNIVQYLQQDKLVIASVTVGMEGGKEYKQEDGSIYVMPKGGHLVVIFGADVSQGEIKSFLLHHPSSDKDYEHRDWVVSKDEFLKSFSEKGNILVF